MNHLGYLIKTALNPDNVIFHAMRSRLMSEANKGKPVPIQYRDEHHRYGPQWRRERELDAISSLPSDRVKSVMNMVSHTMAPAAGDRSATLSLKPGLEALNKNMATGWNNYGGDPLQTAKSDARKTVNKLVSERVVKPGIMPGPISLSHVAEPAYQLRSPGAYIHNHHTGPAIGDLPNIPRSQYLSSYIDNMQRRLATIASTGDKRVDKVHMTY
jgi:hypothetical protein